jgi:hypothetical protein
MPGSEGPDGRISVMLRVYRLHYNYGEWLVGTTGIEPVTPTMSR